MKTAFLCVRRTALAFAAFALFASSFTRAATATATAGQTATLTVTADGTTPFTYQWTLNGANITGATAATYVISNVKLTDAATYSVVVSNSAGSTTSDNAALTVVPAASVPTFTTQPASQTVTAGSAVTFAALASGSPAPAYQWQMNGMNIPGATGTSYTITNTGLSNAGSYTLVASNTAGSATSSGAVLAVNTVPTITTQPANQTVNVRPKRHVRDRRQRQSSACLSMAAIRGWRHNLGPTRQRHRLFWRHHLDPAGRQRAR